MKDQRFITVRGNEVTIARHEYGLNAPRTYRRYQGVNDASLVRIAQLLQGKSTLMVWPYKGKLTFMFAYDAQ